MPILRFLWKYKIGSIIAGAVFIITFPVISAALMLYTSCAIAGIMWRVFEIRLGGVGEACTAIWVALLFHLFNLIAFLVVGAIIEMFVKRFLHKPL